MRRERGRIAVVRAVLAAALATVLGSAGVVPPAAAAGPASLALTGRGWGHGHGMSQYGAQNAAANKGRSAAQILDFYYPGTRAATASGALRVLLTSTTSTAVTIGTSPSLKVRSVGGASVALSRPGAVLWRLTGVPGSPHTWLWVQTSTTGWTLVRTLTGQAEFLAAEPLRLYLPGGSALYRGALRSAQVPGGTARRTVNVVGLDQYLLGVVPREVPATWHPQAVRAQAIAARTYAVHERDTTDRGYFDVWDSTQSQVYGGVGAEHPASTTAVIVTTTQVRTYGGKPAFTQFGSSNGGWTAPGSAPYLPGRQDTWDTWAGNPNAQWRVDVTDDAIERAWPAIGDFAAVTILTRDRPAASGGRVTSIRVRGAAGTVTVSGDRFRSALGLKSTLFFLAG